MIRVLHYICHETVIGKLVSVFAMSCLPCHVFAYPFITKSKI